MRRIVLILGLLAAGCQAVTPLPPPRQVASGTRAPVDAAAAAAAFTEVSRAVGPRAVEECRARTSGVNCDFRIVVDPDPRAPINAYQSLDDQGRPVITFTAAMIVSAQNPDELAFVMGHEAAHHIRGHLRRQAQNAQAGAAIFGELASLTGDNQSAVEAAAEIGAEVGARVYSKEFELEADELGTIITLKAGYDPRLGAQFFTRLPDPGNRFLGTHPPNAARIATVEQTAARVGR